MDKISELKEKLNPYNNTNAFYGERELWGYGFDAAMELQLPVLFAEWLSDSRNIKTKPKELFNYWLENIYQPE